SLIRKKVLIQEGRRVGMNIHISEWQTKNNGFCKTLAKPAKKTLAEVANAPKQKLLTTKDKLTKDNIKRSTSENSDESSDKPAKKPHVLKPEAAIQRGNKWGTAEDLTAAEWMFDLIKTISPSARKPNLAGWANDIRLMRECDGRTHRDMCVLFRWACHDSFWAGNVISPAKLREKWTQLDINRNKQQTGTTASKPKLDLNNTDWIYGVEL
ncbi:replication protein, partial [Salmonella enterica]|nr:replication protein [Salmonella enterica]